MSKRVLVDTVGRRVFRDLEEAAEALGVTAVAVSKAVKDQRECQGARLRWAERVYAVKTFGGNWYVVGMSGDNRRYVRLDELGGYVKKSDVAIVKELTVAWYLRAD
ncbi:MAG: hypothetical protein J6T35_02370 [Bacteroidales bacterium]|nr:hypothetical protein [Bacteroidales bacterium]